MKPRKLTMQAFGPFAGREQVDFSSLPDDALFLIHGPTGAGKTTLLDGICYALYGSTSGNERKASEMRSHHAPDSLLTEVELEFELGGQRYKIKRAPEQERAALRGTGTVKATARAELQRHDGTEWKTLTARPTEVTEKVEQLLGFEADQFRQVIMLPQGQFRKLLTAETRERERIMETLFATEKYRRLQDRLQESARRLERRAEEKMSKRQTLLEQAGAESEEALAASTQELAQALEGLAPQLATARTAADAAAHARADGEALAERFREHDQAQKAIQGLLENDTAILAERERLERANKAQQAEPAWSVLSAAIAHHERQRLKTEAAANAAGKADEACLGAEKTLAAETGRENEREMIRFETARLEGMAGSVARMEQAQHARDETAKAHAAADALLEKHALDAQSLAERRRTLNAEIERLSPVASSLEAARLEAANLERILQTVRKMAEVDQELGRTNAAVVASSEKLEAAQALVISARDRREELGEAWRSGQAAVLARHLADGHACPVCGSQEHPHPASQAANVPSEAEIKAAAAAVQTAENAFNATREAHASLEISRNSHLAAMQTFRETLDGHDWEAYLTPGRRQARLDEARAKLQQANQAAQDLVRVKNQAHECEAAVQAAEAALAAARSEAMRTGSEAAAAEAALKTLADTVPDGMRTKAALDAAIARSASALALLVQAHEKAQQAFEAAKSARAAAAARLDGERIALSDAGKRQVEAQAAFDEVLSNAAFADADAFLAARLEPEVRACIDRQLREHEQAKAAAGERLARAKEAIAGTKAPDLEALGATLQLARAALESLLERNGILQQRLDSSKRTAALLDEIRTSANTIEREYRVLGELAAVASGKNGANMAFQRYVLAALLDDVLRQASLRLKTMSRNRYSLQRSGGVSDGRRAAGLDLEVLDDYTGRTRPSNTLSGGEGFMASLALALGLSDTVQAYAGGVKLDALFIDEGFGTLDPESLDLAMKALADLQQRGRMVGIISHVEELKRQIDNGIEIRFSASGSTVRVGSAAPEKS